MSSPKKGVVMLSLAIIEYAQRLELVYVFGIEMEKRVS